MAATAARMEELEPEDDWRLDRAAQFLGISPRTLERYVAARMVPCVVLPSPVEGAKPIITFVPSDLRAWRDQYRIGKVRR